MFVQILRVWKAWCGIGGRSGTGWERLCRCARNGCGVNCLSGRVPCARKVPALCTGEVWLDGKLIIVIM